MCFAFSSTEQQLTARSYPERDLTPPAMTMLVDRGTEKRTGIRSRRMPHEDTTPGPAPAGADASASSSSSSAAAGAPSVTGGGSAAGGSSSSRPKGKGKRSPSPGKPKQSPKSVSKDAAALLADPRLKPTGHKGKVKPLPIH